MKKREINEMDKGYRGYKKVLDTAMINNCYIAVYQHKKDDCRYILEFWEYTGMFPDYNKSTAYIVEECLDLEGLDQIEAFGYLYSLLDSSY